MNRTASNVKEIAIRVAFYIIGLLTSLAAVVLPEIASEAYLRDETGPIIFNVIWTFIPFAVLPSLLRPSRRAILATVLVTLTFWIAVFIAAREFKGGANIGLGAFFVCLYPVFVILVVLGVERLLTRAHKYQTRDSP